MTAPTTDRWLATFPDGSQVMAERWPDGTVTMATRAHPSDMWGPPEDAERR